MVTVGYEQQRGLRAKHQSCTGEYRANASKTIAVPLAVLFKNWLDPKLRSAWLPDAKHITIHKSTLNKSMRITLVGTLEHDGVRHEVVAKSVPRRFFWTTDTMEVDGSELPMAKTK
jgi:uncharacterized protein YndB with AHSA1/START domain